MESRRIKKRNRQFKIGYYFILLLLLSLVGNGCKSKKIISSIESPKVSNKELIEALNANYSGSPEIYYDRVKVSLSANGNTQVFSGRISIKKDQEIYIEVNAILGVEVARVLINRDGITVRSNFEKKLYLIDYKSLKSMLGITGDFSTLEHILGYEYYFQKPGLYEISNVNNTYNIRPDNRIAGLIKGFVANYEEFGSVVNSIQICETYSTGCFNVDYFDFYQQGGYRKPGLIKVIDERDNFKLELSLGKAKFHTPLKHSLGNVSNFTKQKL